MKEMSSLLFQLQIVTDNYSFDFRFVILKSLKLQ